MASENVIDVTDSDFEEGVLKSDVATIVDFWAEWCGPCKAVAPKIEELAEKYAGKIKVAKMDIDSNPDTPAKYGVKGIPTIILFKGGSDAGQVVGNQPIEKLEELFEQGL